MNAVLYHPDEMLLASYSAASLPLSQALCISAHLEHCSECRQKIQQLNSVGGELMQKLDPAPATDLLKDELLARLDTLEDMPAIRQPEVDNDSIPRALRQFVDSGYQNLNWSRVSPDIHSAELCRDSNGAKVELLRIRAGGAATRHTHLGDEYTVILQGSFSDEEGLYRCGDFIRRDSRHEHRPVATQDMDCICLAVTEGPVQFTGFFSRMLNPLIRRSYA